VHVRALLVLIAACAPTVATPVEHQAALDREESARIAAQLAALPGAQSAQVTLHRPTIDPFTQHATPGAAAVAIAAEPSADRAALADAARALVHASAPDISAPMVAFTPAAPRTVTRDNRPLAALLALLAVSAGFIAWRERPSGRSPKPEARSPK
jgi:type III secretory pathway lipoprotein EscJ